uniref:CX domain-containing protein n=1 Tax=Caenorhabditis tropicalis TaxID=1561998 RepID=A0A1I7UPK8_9PELO
MHRLVFISLLFIGTHGRTITIDANGLSNSENVNATARIEVINSESDEVEETTTWKPIAFTIHPPGKESAVDPCYLLYFICGMTFTALVILAFCKTKVCQRHYYASVGRIQEPGLVYATPQRKPSRRAVSQVSDD